jgi:uncharacterized protein (TIRG00374 family)
MTSARGGSWRLKTAFGYAAAAILLWLFLRNAGWANFRDGLRSVLWPLLAAAVVLRLAALVVAALRWQALLEPAGQVPLGGVVAATMIGMAASAIAPMQAAELVRPYVLSSQQGVDFSTALATALAEWFLDGFAILALFTPAALWLHAAGSARVWLVGGLLLPLSVAGVAGLRILPRRAAGVADWIHLHSPLGPSARLRVVDWTQSFLRGLRALDRRRGLAGVVGYSVLLSALTAISAWLTLGAFDLPLTFAAGFVLLGLITIAGMVPTPGAVGGFHAVCQLGLVSFFGIERSRTVLPVIALHAVLYLPGAFLGVLCFLMWPCRSQRVTP